MSLRWRLVVGTALITLFAVGTAGVVVASIDRWLTMSAVDEALGEQIRSARYRTIGRIFYNLFAHDHQRDHGRERDGLPPVNTMLAMAWSLTKPDLAYHTEAMPSELADQLPDAFNGDDTYTTLVVNDTPWRVYGSATDSLPRSSRRSKQEKEFHALLPFQVVVARPLEPVFANLNQRRWLLAATALAATALAAAGAWLLSRKLLAPLNHLSQQIAETEAIADGASIDLPQAPQELRPVVARLNELLQRVADAVARERRVNADIAHELRTPLAGIRSQLEFALAYPDHTKDIIAASTSSLTIAIQMQELVENLLMLVRLDAKQVAIEHQATDVDQLISATLELLAPRLQDQQLSVLFKPQGCTIASDSVRLRMILANLVANCIAHAPPQSAVTVRADARALVVSNPLAEAVDASVAHQAREPFWRGDESRGDTGLHCGLGLSIVDRLCHALGWHLDISTANQCWSVTITWSDGEVDKNGDEMGDDKADQSSAPPTVIA